MAQFVIFQSASYILKKKILTESSNNCENPKCRGMIFFVKIHFVNLAWQSRYNVHTGQVSPTSNSKHLVIYILDK